MRFLIALTAATTTGALFAATALAATPFTPSAHAPRVISRTHDGQPILLGTVTVTATALPD